jgi:putative flippase GtrA
MNLLTVYQKHRNVINYGVIGVSAIVVDVSFFFIFYNFLFIPPMIATVLSVLVAMVYAFTLNAVYNFKTKDLIKARFLSYTVVSVFGMIASAMIIAVLVSLAIDANIAKIISLPPIVVLQYIFNKTFTFKETV